MGIASEAARGAQPGAITGEASHRGSDGFRRAHATEHQSHNSQHQRGSEDDEDDHDVIGDMARDGLAVEANGINNVGVQAVAEDGSGVAEEDEHAHGLQSSRGGTGHTATDGHNQQQEGDGYRPERIVGYHRARGGEGADGLHGTQP